MKIKSITTYSEAKKENFNSKRIDLNSITNLVNELNEVIAPELMEELNESKKLLESKNGESKSKINELKSLNDETMKLKEEESLLKKRLSVVSLLTSMHASFVINESVKKETLILLNDLDKYPVKRLDAQIAKLESILNGG